MRYVRRELESQVLAAARSFSAVVLTGPRRSGKTLTLRRLFPYATYVLAEDSDVIARLQADPQGRQDAAARQRQGSVFRDAAIRRAVDPVTTGCRSTGRKDR